MKKVFLSLGSNLGDRGKNLSMALEELAKRGVAILKKSSIYEAEPVGYKDQPWFYNMAIEGEFEGQPADLFKIILELEKVLGRVRSAETKKWGPRTIDIDIIFFGSEVVKTENLQIPHLQMVKRLFVLQPLVEIAPNFVHPISNKSVQQLLNDCEDRSIVRPLN